MKKEKVYVLVKDAPEYVRLEIVGVFSEDGKQKKLNEFAEQERLLLQMFLNDSARATENCRERRAEIAYGDAKLLENAGQHLTTAEIHMHEKNLREIDALTKQIAQFNAYGEKVSKYSDEQFAQDYMSRMHLIFHEFEVE